MSKEAKLQCDETAVAGASQILEPGEELLWACCRTQPISEFLKLLLLAFVVMGSWFVIKYTFFSSSSFVFDPVMWGWAILGAAICGFLVWQPHRKEILAITNKRIFLVRRKTLKISFSMDRTELRGIDKVITGPNMGTIRLLTTLPWHKQYLFSGKNPLLKGIQQVNEVAELLEQGLDSSASN